MSGPARALVLALALCAAAYARTLGGEFQFDDTHTIVQNLAVKELGGFLRAGLLQGYAAGARPVTDLTYALNYAVGGLEPWNFHLTSLAIHLLVVLLVWALARELLRLAGAARPEWVAVAAAGAFALHPLQSEAVAYLSQRSEVLASGLYVATLLLLLAGERRGLGRRGAPWFAGALATFALALGAKAIAITLPAAWLLLAGLVPAAERRAGLLPWRARLVALAPFAALDALFAWRVLAGLDRASGAGFDLPGLTPLRYLSTQLRVLPTYLRLLLWPAGQNVDWELAPSTGPGDLRSVLSGLLLLAIAAGAVAAWRATRGGAPEDAAAGRLAPFGLAWFALLLSPTSSVVPLADLLVEHRVYLAALGPLLALAVAGERLLARLPPRPARVAGGAALLLLGVGLAAAVHARNAVWESELALWRDAASKSPAKPRPRMSLAYALRVAGRVEEAIAEYRRAADLARADPEERALILRNLGAALIWAGRAGDAVTALEAALALAPDDPVTLTNLAVAARAQGAPARAASFARRAVALDPAVGDAWNVLGAVELDEGNLDGARAALERAVALDPDVGVRAYNLGRVLDRQGDRVGACAAWRRAVAGRLAPSLRRDVDALRARAGCRP